MLAVDHVPEYSAVSGQDMLRYSGEQPGRPANDYPSSSGRESESSEAYGSVTTISSFDGISLSGSARPSQNSNALINFSRPYQNIFQGCCTQH